MCFMWISEQTAIISLHSINLPVFTTEAESVYCAVRNGPLNAAHTVPYLKGQLPLVVVAMSINHQERLPTYLIIDLERELHTLHL